VGFTRREIGELIDAWYKNKFSKEEKLNILDEKLLLLEQKLKEIKEMKTQIEEFKKDVLDNKC
jgi:MerR family Zn(II)-responsive transcriptional regulator of zntA